MSGFPPIPPKEGYRELQYLTCYINEVYKKLQNVILNLFVWEISMKFDP